ncbi:hypothetical protein D3C85_1355480 [compost metagenome]
MVQMQADVSNERDQLRTELSRAKAELSVAQRQSTDIETKSNWELMSKDKVISELYAKIRTITGVDPAPGPLANPMRRHRSIPER